MCGRFGLEFKDDFYPRFNVGNILYDFASRYNIAPGQYSPVIGSKNSKFVIRNSHLESQNPKIEIHPETLLEYKFENKKSNLEESRRVSSYEFPVSNFATSMKWGLVPAWAKDEKIGYKMINARAETIAEKPSFRTAFKRNRVLIPASHFYEWKKEDNKKIPYYIGLKNTQYFSFAGLAETWTSPDGKELKTFTIITKPANSEIAKIHDRMPVILDQEEEQAWLESDDKDFLMKILNSNFKTPLEIYQIAPLVNSPAHDSSDLIKPV